MSSRHWRRGRRRTGVAEIIGAILLIGLTITAGAILWSFRIYTPPSTPVVNFLVRSGSSSPAWGDPTDCQPTGYVLSDYPLSSGEYQTWSNDWYAECYVTATGNFSVMNATEIVVSSISSAAPLSLSQVHFSFVCYNATSAGGTTTLVTGTLASMTWFPGLSTQPAPDAPSLGYCGNFDAGGWSFVSGLTPANGTLYNRLGFFDPLRQGETSLTTGDTFYLYLHYGGYPVTFLCVAADLGGYSWYPTSYCPAPLQLGHPQLDYDDYHGAPPWCFTNDQICKIIISYSGSPAAVLAEIPIATLAPL